MSSPIDLAPLPAAASAPYWGPTMGRASDHYHRPCDIRAAVARPTGSVMWQSHHHTVVNCQSAPNLTAPFLHRVPPTGNGSLLRHTYHTAPLKLLLPRCSLRGVRCVLTAGDVSPPCPACGLRPAATNLCTTLC